MDNEKFRYRKTTRRNDFTTVFGGVGEKRDLRAFAINRPRRTVYRFKFQKYRRAAQGWKNQTFGKLTRLKMLTKFGLRQPVRRFRV